MFVRTGLEELPNFRDDESSFDEDYVPKPILDPDKLHEELKLDFQKKESLIHAEVDMAHLLKAQEETERNIQKRLDHHTRIMAKEGRQRAKLIEAALSAEAHDDSDSSSINTEEEAFFCQKRNQCQRRTISVRWNNSRHIFRRRKHTANTGGSVSPHRRGHGKPRN